MNDFTLGIYSRSFAGFRFSLDCINFSVPLAPFVAAGLDSNYTAVERVHPGEMPTEVHRNYAASILADRKSVATTNEPENEFPSENGESRNKGKRGKI